MKRGTDLAAEDQGEWLSKQLRDPELCVAYLNAALAEGDQAAFMLALRNVAKARGGVAAMARETGMNRVALSRALSEAGNPELRSLTKILEASGLEFKVVPKGKRSTPSRPHSRTKPIATTGRVAQRGARY
jgi:probable addiction module antidote protein